MTMAHLKRATSALAIHAFKPHHEDSNSPPSTHLASSTPPTLPTLMKSGSPRTSHESVPVIWIFCHAQAEQPGTHFGSAVRPSHQALRGDILVRPPGLLLIVRWTKTIQSLGSASVLPKPEVKGHPADPDFLLEYCKIGWVDYNTSTSWWMIFVVIPNKYKWAVFQGSINLNLKSGTG